MQKRPTSPGGNCLLLHYHRTPGRYLSNSLSDRHLLSWLRYEPGMAGGAPPGLEIGFRLPSPVLASNTCGRTAPVPAEVAGSGVSSKHEDRLRPVPNRIHNSSHRTRRHGCRFLPLPRTNWTANFQRVGHGEIERRNFCEML